MNKKENKIVMKDNEKRHVKEIIEDNETITIVYEKDEKFEGIKITDDGGEPANDESDPMDMEDIEPSDNDEDTEEEIEETLEEDEDENALEDEEEDEEDEEDEEEYSRKLWSNEKSTEKRFFNIQTRVDKKEKRNIVSGHAAVFGTLSEDLGGFREKIMPNAFDDVLDNDVRAFFNHDPNFLLARTSSGTLKLGVDKKGLTYSFDVPDTTAGRDLLVSMERGDISQSSFAFNVEKDSWSEENGTEIRTIEKVGRLYDVSPVSIPAYPDADDLVVAKRSLMTYKDKTKIKNENEWQIKTDLLKLKINIIKRKLK
tara:strand:+ start:4319 stop:5257 length:939 start_codon:yes stop_codon:yes gene_type:complete